MPSPTADVLPSQAGSYERHVELARPYVDAVHDAGDLCWWEEDDRRQAVALKLGLPVDTEPEAVRRELWERHRKGRA